MAYGENGSGCRQGAVAALSRETRLSGAFGSRRKRERGNVTRPVQNAEHATVAKHFR
jgi:hypothetical protein